MLAYRANPNLAKKLVRAKLKRPTKKHNKTSCNSSGTSNCSNNNNNNSGSAASRIPPHDIAIVKMANIKHNIDIGLKVTTKKCGDHTCPLHGKLRSTNQTRSRVSGRAYITRGLADCNTKYVVYLIQCKRCDQQYVGQTSQSLKDRITRHMQKIDNTNDSNTLHDHFRKGQCRGIQNIIIQVLHVLETNRDDKALSKREREKLS